MIKDVFGLAEPFLLRPEFVEDDRWKNLHLNLSSGNIESLTKVFMYGSYIRSQNARNMSTKDVIKSELSHYPYTKKIRFQA